MITKLRADQPVLSTLPLVGIIKEIAPTKRAQSDEELGVGEFQRKYFKDCDLYLDEKMQFYQVLGSRKLSLPTWNPFELWRGYQELTERMKPKSIEGNMVGEGVTLGGVLVIGRGDRGVIHTHLEKTGEDPENWIPEIREAALRIIPEVA